MFFFIIALMKVILICGDTLSSCCLSNGWIWCYQDTYFSKIINVEICQMVDQAKIALTLVQNWIYKIKVIDLKNKHFFLNHHVKRTSFQIHSNKFYSKNDNILLVIEFRRKS